MKGSKAKVSEAKPTKSDSKKGPVKDRETELLEIKQLLLDERARVVLELKKTESRIDMERDGVSGDDADIAASQIQAAEQKKHGSRLLKLLKKIDYSLSKFEDGSFGICELTGEDIPIPRLRARPTALYTVEAKEELERKERKFRSFEDEDDDVGFDDEVD